MPVECLAWLNLSTIPPFFNTKEKANLSMLIVTMTKVNHTRLLVSYDEIAKSVVITLLIFALVQNLEQQALYHTKQISENQMM